MKKVLKIAGAVVALLALVGLGSIAFIYFKGIPRYKVEMPAELTSLKVAVTPTSVERGAKISAFLCKACHLGADGRLSGKQLLDIPKEFGTVYSANITQSKTKGIGNWTDGQLIYFLRTGIKPTGEYAPAYMPKFPNMANEDLEAIVAYLRSDKEDLQASENKMPANQPNFLVKFLCNVAFKPFPYPAAPITIPDSSDKVKFGEYIANGLVNCYSCHSKDFKTVNDLEPSKSEGFYGGGNPLLNEEGQVVVSANITLDEQTGIGLWSEQSFIEAVKYCKNPKGGNPLRYPMIPHSSLTDYEASAIFAYLKTIPKIHNPLQR